MPPVRAGGEESSAFGFSAIRFALQPGFTVERLTDDQVEGHDCHFVRVTDPTGAHTVFGIDRQTYAVRSAGWSTPKGFHQRLYRWTSVEVGRPIPDATFILGPPIESGG